MKLLEYIFSPLVFSIGFVSPLIAQILLAPNLVIEQTTAYGAGLGFVIATFNVAASYRPSHEAQHNIIANKGQPLRWLNELVGHLSTIPLAMPYRVLLYTQYEHHRHCNNPELDPDYSVHAATNWQFLRKSTLNRQPGT